MGTAIVTESYWVHYNDVIMGTMAFQITSLMIVYSIIYSRSDHRKHQSSASLAFVRGIHQGPVNSLHKGPVTRKMFSFDDVIMRPVMIHWAAIQYVLCCKMRDMIWMIWYIRKCYMYLLLCVTPWAMPRMHQWIMLRIYFCKIMVYVLIFWIPPVIRISGVW